MTFRTTALMNQTPKIACLPNGPYYLLNDMTAAPVPNLRRANGEPCATVRGVALCRCGGSRNKPFCDGDRKSTRLNSSHDQISYAVFCLKKKKKRNEIADDVLVQVRTNIN